MFDDEYRIVDGKKLRRGWTTGSCAAAAAKAAAFLLLNKEAPLTSFEVEITTPAGPVLRLWAEDVQRGSGWASCAVRKDAGDDPDITCGVLVYARVERSEGGDILLDGGEGVGRVTKEGLDAPPGAAAINKIPRRMILENADEIRARAGYSGGLSICISIPGGAELARRTFNEKLGIVGGLSVLGTRGIVEPVSAEAMAGALRAELSVLYASGERTVVITPGNYGRNFLDLYPAAARLPEPVKCGNLIGETIDMAAAQGFERLILAGHIGKLVKLVTGNFDTHSRYGDPRLAIFTALAAASPQGCSPALAGKLLDCAVSEQAIDLLKEAGSWDFVQRRILEHIRAQLDHRAARSGSGLRCQAVVFSPKYGLLGVSHPSLRAFTA